MATLVALPGTLRSFTMNTHPSRCGFVWIAACLVVACLLASCRASHPRQDIICEVVSADLRPGKYPGEVKARLRVNLSALRSSAVCYPYADMAFHIRRTQKPCVIAAPKPRFRPPPAGGRENQVLVLSRTPLTVDVELADWYELSLASGSTAKGTQVVFDVQYSKCNHSSNYALVKGTIE